MPLAVDGDRLLADLAAYRRIGGRGNGVVRRAFSEPDLEARRLVARHMAEAGLDVRWDPIGNIFGLPPGDGPCLLVGSHSDTQPEGGWLDGIYGVAVGLAVARAARAAGGPRVAVVSFQDEEGAFASLMGSRWWTGAYRMEDLREAVDSDGRRLGPLLDAVPEIQGAQPVEPERFSGFLEAHIEQGPVLHETGEAIGVVTSIVGSRNYALTIEGQQNHAGTTPMDRRRDAVTGLIRFGAALHEAFAGLRGESTVWTMGRIEVRPNAVSIVPGRAEVSVQFRDPDEGRLQLMAETVERLAAETARGTGLRFDLEARPPLAPTAIDRRLQQAIAEAAEARVPGRWRRMPSGALHDAASVAAVLPVAMLFVPSIGGVSHSFEEDTALPDLVTGAEVMAGAVERVAT